MRVATTGVVLLGVLAAVAVAAPLATASSAAPSGPPAPHADRAADGSPPSSLAPRQDSADPGSVVTAGDEGDLHQRIYFDLTPREAGSVTVTVTYDPSPDVYTFVIAPVEEAVVRNVDGFVRDQEDNGWRYEWDRTTPDPSITYVVGNSTRTNWGVDAVDVGEWALVKPSPPSTAFYSTTDEQWVYSYGPGADRITAESSASTDYHYAGRYLFLGDHEVRRVSRNGQAVIAVIPAAANLTVPAEDTIDLVLEASTLDVGGRDERVTMFYAPEPLAQNGLSDGDAAFWVGATRADSVYIHEYVHTRQNYTPAANMTWIDEGSADYFEFRLWAETNYSTYRGFYARMNRSVDGVVLSNPDTYGSRNLGDYVEGRRLLAALDYKIRTATDKRRSLADVFRRMNEHEGELTYDEFVAIVEDVSGEEMRPWLDRYVTTDASPEVPYDPYAYTADDADVDDDGLPTVDEERVGSDPFALDTDADGLFDGREVEADTDPTEPDTDGDGIGDGREVEIGIDPGLADTDGDGMDDGAELSYGTDPGVADSDGDGLEDGREIDLGADPDDSDTDGDGIEDGPEADQGTDPTAADTDRDGLDDDREVDLGTDPTATDTDGDGLGDGEEVELGTDPVTADTDGDGVGDGREVDDGTDPTDPESPGETTTTATQSNETPADASTSDSPDDSSGGETERTGGDDAGGDGTEEGSSGGLPAPGPALSLVAVLVGGLLVRRRRART